MHSSSSDSRRHHRRRSDSSDSGRYGGYIPRKRHSNAPTGSSSLTANHQWGWCGVGFDHQPGAGYTTQDVGRLQQVKRRGFIVVSAFEDFYLSIQARRCRCRLPQQFPHDFVNPVYSSCVDVEAVLADSCLVCRDSLLCHVPLDRLPIGICN